MVSERSIQKLAALKEKYSADNWILYQEKKLKCFENAFNKKGNGWVMDEFDVIKAPMKGIRWLSFTVSEFEEEPAYTHRCSKTKQILLKWIDLLYKHQNIYYDDNKLYEYQDVLISIVSIILKILNKNKTENQIDIKFCDIKDMVATLRKHYEDY